MQHSKTVDTLVGLFVATGIGALFFLAMQVSNLSSFFTEDSYTITARFENSGGLKVKSSVSFAGVRIGRVSAIHFDNDTYQSVVEMRIEAKYNKIPDDTTASILTAGLLGEQFVGLDAGGSDEYFINGGEVLITQSALVLEKLISQLLYSFSEKSETE